MVKLRTKCAGIEIASWLNNGLPKCIFWTNFRDNGKKKDYEYQHFLKLFYSNSKNFADEIEIIEKDVIKGRTDYNVFNYSLKEFFYILQQN